MAYYDGKRDIVHFNTSYAYF